MNCPRCGLALNAPNESCGRCPAPPIASPSYKPRQFETGVTPNPADKPSFFLECLAFTFPLFGLLIYFAYYRKGDWPVQGARILKGSLWGLVLQAMLLGYLYYELSRFVKAESRF